VPVALVDDAGAASEGVERTGRTDDADGMGGIPAERGPVGGGRAHGELRIPSDAAGRCAASPDPETYAKRTSPNAMPAATPTLTAERGAQR
jgi:hypothetical protein